MSRSGHSRPIPLDQTKRVAAAMLAAMWETRYGEAARRRRAEAITAAAERLVAVTTKHAVPDEGEVRIGDLLPLLVQEHGALLAAIQACPAPVVLDPDGEVDPSARPLTGLVGRLAVFAVRYHGLDVLPELLRTTLRYDLDTIRTDAQLILGIDEDSA